MGIIVKRLEGKDGKVRTVILKTLRSDGIGTFMKRPIEKLYPLEIRCRENILESDIENKYIDVGDNQDIDDDKMYSIERSRRKAADNGILMRRLLGT